MTIKELIKEVAAKESGWCLCSTPDLQLSQHCEDSLVEKIVTRVIDRCEKAMLDALHKNGIVDVEDADGENGKWIAEEFRERVMRRRCDECHEEKV